MILINYWAILIGCRQIILYLKCFLINHCQKFQIITHIATVKNYYQHPNWMLRMAVVTTLEIGHERGEIEAERLKYELEQIHSTSSHFEPNFLLANRLRDLTKQVLSAIDQSIGE